MLTPGGSFLLICSTAAPSRCATTRVFSPSVMSATPATAWPLPWLVTAPSRGIGASTTSATFLTYSGEPPAAVRRTILPMSPIDSSSPSPRMTACSPLRDRRTAGSAIVLGHRVVDVLDRQAKSRQCALGDAHLVGLEFATVDVHLSDARDLLELRCALPIQDRAQLHERIVLALHLELIDLGEAVGEWAQHGRPGARRQRRLAQALRHQRAVGQDVAAVGELHIDDGEPVAGDRTVARHAGQTLQRELDRRGDRTLHVQGGKTRCLGGDQHL